MSSESILVLTTLLGFRMYHKALLFNDQEIADAIALEPEPSQQKALGRKVKGFDRQKWKEKREKIVEQGNWWKFTQPKEGPIGSMLLETGDRLLVEASPYDRIWGIGYGASTAEDNRGTWGENLLGKALMRVRERLRAEVDDITDENGARREAGVTR